jgi:hypothetical protein
MLQILFMRKSANFGVKIALKPIPYSHLRFRFHTAVVHDIALKINGRAMLE